DRGWFEHEGDFTVVNKLIHILFTSTPIRGWNSVDKCRSRHGSISIGPTSSAKGKASYSHVTHIIHTGYCLNIPSRAHHILTAIQSIRARGAIRGKVWDSTNKPRRR